MAKSVAEAFVIFFLPNIVTVRVKLLSSNDGKSACNRHLMMTHGGVEIVLKFEFLNTYTQTHKTLISHYIIYLLEGIHSSPDRQQVIFWLYFSLTKTNRTETSFKILSKQLRSVCLFEDYISA